MIKWRKTAWNFNNEEYNFLYCTLPKYLVINYNKTLVNLNLIAYSHVFGLKWGVIIIEKSFWAEHHIFCKMVKKNIKFDSVPW